MKSNGKARFWLSALVMLGAAAAGTVSDAAAYSGPSSPSAISDAAPRDNGDGGAPRGIIVLSDNVNITLAAGTFGTDLLPFPDISTGEASFRVDRPLQLTGQLVDGNFTLLSYGGGQEAARRNQGVAGHGEVVRWWFNGVEQAPLRVSWRPPGDPDDRVINGTFFVRDWVPDRELVPAAGKCQMRFSFAGTTVRYPGLGEFQIYPPKELALEVLALFPTRTEVLPLPGPVDAGSNVEIGGQLLGTDGNLSCSGGLVVSSGGRTLGPPMPKGLFLDEVEVSVPGIPTVIFHEGFENGAAGWELEGGDWGAGQTAGEPGAFRGMGCLGTGLRGSYSHLADERAGTPPIDMSRFLAEASLSFALWADLHAGDRAELSVWNGSEWSDPAALSVPAREWTVLTVGLGDLAAHGHTLKVLGTPELRVRFRLVGTTPSAPVERGRFSLELSIPADAPAGPQFLIFRSLPAGPYSPSFAYLKVDVRARTAFVVPDGGPEVAHAGGWFEVRGRLVDGAGNPLALPPGRQGGDLIRALWDDGAGNVTEAESVTGPNLTGWFAAAHRIPDGAAPGNASFILNFGGTADYQGAAARVDCILRGTPRFELEEALDAVRGGSAPVRGRLLAADRPLAGVEVSVSFGSTKTSVATDSSGQFLVVVPVPLDWQGPTVHVRLSCFAGVAGPGAGMEPAEAAVSITVSRTLALQFEGAPLPKGRAVETVLGDLRFNGLAGRVIDESGRGTPGVEVAVQAVRAGGREVIGTGRTGPDGYFSLPYTVDWSMSCGELRLEAVAGLPPSMPVRREAVFNVTAGTILRLDAPPALAPGVWVEIGGVLSEERDGAPGDPVRDALVVVRFGGREYPALTDPGGRFRASCAVELSQGNITIAASYAGTTALGPSSRSAAVQVRALTDESRPLAPSGEAPAAAGRAMATGSVLAALVAAAVIGGTEAGRFKLLMALVPLYSKIRKEEVLDQFVRGQVFGYVQANPGDHYSSIRQMLKLKNGTLAYHLRTLERENFVFSRMDGIFRRFYPTGMDPARVRLKDNVKKTHKRILELIEGQPGITPKELAGMLGASHQVASYHVRILARRGRIRLQQKGRNTLCYPVGAGSGGTGP